MGLTATLLPAIRNITMLAVTMMRVATVVILIKEIMCSGFYMVYTSNSQNLVCNTIYTYIYIYIYFFFFFLAQQTFSECGARGLLSTEQFFR